MGDTLGDIMKVKIEIDLHLKSEKYLKLFDEYEEIPVLPKLLTGRTIIHTYPIKDTLTNDEEFLGFRDSLYFKIVVVNHEKDTDIFTIFKSKEVHDCIEFIIPIGMKVFKDLSTMFFTDRAVQIMIGQVVFVYPEDYFTEKVR